MSQPNEPPLALDSWYITVKLNDGTDFKLEPDDLPINMLRGIEDVVNEGVEFRIDHLRGKYAGEVPNAVESKPKFNSWYQKPDGSLVPLVEVSSNLKNAASEPEEAEDLHAQNSEKFVDYEKK
jgi:hypothetical protein